MPVPTLSLSQDPPLSIAGDVLVLGVRKTDEGPELLSDDDSLAPLALALAAIGVTGAQDEVRRVPWDVAATESIALVGVGTSVTAESLRYAAGSVARQLRGIESLVIALPSTSDEESLAILEGAGIGAYVYTEYRSSSLESTKLPATEITVAAPGTEALVDRATVVAQAMHSVRDLVNAPASDLYPETFATREWFFGAPGGERFEDVWDRVASWVADQPPEPQRRTIAVSHGVAGRLLRGVYAGLSRQETLNQDVPQDAIYRLVAGNIHRIDCKRID